MVRIYTRAGDQGETGLSGGVRVSKASPRIEAYGAVDELNGLLGVVASRLASQEEGTGSVIQRVQNRLHTICADLASPDPGGEVPRIGPKHVEALEALCDQFEERLPPLNRFILPGGSEVGALLHYARTVARRAERRTVALAAQVEINAEVVKYLNRLSDLLFLMARWANQRAGIQESHPDYSRSTPGAGTA